MTNPRFPGTRYLRRCNVCGSTTAPDMSIPAQRYGHWPTCGHDDWSWVVVQPDGGVAIVPDPTAPDGPDAETVR